MKTQRAIKLTDDGWTHDMVNLQSASFRKTSMRSPGVICVGPVY